MIVVDSSVWVDFFNGNETLEVRQLSELVWRERIVIGDLILCEVLQGFRDDQDAVEAARAFSAFEFEPMVGHEIALRAAENYRSLRRRGVTISKTIDVLIGTFCIERGYSLLHADRDFEPMVAHLGLRTV